MSWHDSALRLGGAVMFDGPFRNLWPLLVAPALAALVSDRTARRLPTAPAAALAAGALAALPGLVALGVILQALQWGQVLTWRGLVTYRLTPLLAAGMLVYALVRALGRNVEIGRLHAASVPPGERLRLSSERLGLRARELATTERECFVAGVLRPTVFVSAGALEQLDEPGLHAALCHERAHVRGRDTLWLFALSILRDLAPLGRGAALDAFRAAREASADRDAASAAGSIDLAAALVALARPQRPPAVVLPMARGDSLRWRLQALLDEPAPQPVSRGAWAGLALNAALVAWPAAQFELMLVFCAG